MLVSSSLVMDEFSYWDQFSDYFYSADPFVVGLEGPLTGSQSSVGIDMLRGALLAVEIINEEGGVLGRPLQLLSADDSADPDKALDVANYLKAVGADAVVGPYNSSVGLENLDYYIDNKILPVHLTSTDATSGKGVTIQPKNSQISPKESAYILDQDVESVSIVVDPSAYTRGMAERLEASLEAEGVEVNVFEVDPGKESYEALVSDVISDDPDLVYLSTYYPEGGAILEGLEDLGSDAMRFLGLANVDPALIQDVGLELAQSAMFSGVPEADQLPDSQEFVDAYRERFSDDPGVWGVFVYDSFNILVDAINRVDSTDYDDMLSSLLMTENYLGQTGSITVDPLTGNRVDVPVSILRVDEDGGFVPIRQVEDLVVCG